MASTQYDFGPLGNPIKIPDEKSSSTHFRPTKNAPYLEVPLHFHMHLTNNATAQISSKCCSVRRKFNAENPPEKPATSGCAIDAPVVTANVATVTASTRLITQIVWQPKSKMPPTNWIENYAAEYRPFAAESP